jgi:CheY-like chemotaxis protein
VTTVLVCELDPTMRSQIAGVVDAAGHQIVAETDDVNEAIASIERLRPDIVVVDVSLRFSPGRALISTAATCGCQPILFSDYVEPEFRRSARGSPIIVVRPDLLGLAYALRRAAAAIDTPHQRRRVARPTPPGDDFFDALAGASPGDAIIILRPRPPAEHELAIVGDFVQRSVAACDRVAVGTDAVGAFLSGGGEEGIEAVLRRVRGNAGRDLSDWEIRSSVVTEGDPPAIAARVEELLPDATDH